MDDVYYTLFPSTIIAVLLLMTSVNQNSKNRFLFSLLVEISSICDVSNVDNNIVLHMSVGKLVGRSPTHWASEASNLVM